MHIYNRMRKIKYRKESYRHSAAVGGAFGQDIAVDVEYNGLINDKGCKNTNKVPTK